MKKILLPIIFLMNSTLLANEIIFQSQEKQTILIELYTSEGCSSCPPAESWLQQFKDNPLLWKEFIPMAFHVDYWDDLGWKDPFSQKQWTERQQRYQKQGNISQVYTPGFIISGQEWRGFFRREKLSIKQPTCRYINYKVK